MCFAGCWSICLQCFYYSVHRIRPSWHHYCFFCLFTIAQNSFRAKFFFLLCCWNPLPAKQWMMVLYQISYTTYLSFLYSILSLFGHFLAWSEVGVYTFMMLMIFFGFNWSWFCSYLLVCTRNVFHQHKYQDSRIVEEHRFWRILSSIYGSISATSLLLQTHYQSACFSNQKWW